MALIAVKGPTSCFGHMAKPVYTPPAGGRDSLGKDGNASRDICVDIRGLKKVGNRDVQDLPPDRRYLWAWHSGSEAQ